MKKLSNKQQIVREACKKYPHKSDRAISRIIGISQPVVSKYRKENNDIINKQFVSEVAGRFILEFGDAVDYWKMQIDELEELKTGEKQVIKQNSENGGYFQAKMPLEPMEKLQIIKEQANLRARILFIASQGEVREVIKVMRTGQLPSLS